MLLLRSVLKAHSSLTADTPVPMTSLPIPQTVMSVEHAVQCSPMDLVAHGAALTAHIQQPSTQPLAAVRWMHLFANRGVRYEPLLNAAAWKAFKATVPPSAPQLAHPPSSAIVQRGDASPQSADELDAIVSAVTRAFRIVAEQKLVNDHQMLVVGVGKCIECSVVMRPHNLADVMLGMKDLGRLSLTVAEADMYRSRLSSSTAVEDPLLQTSDDLDAHDAKRVELLDELADAVEARIINTAAEFSAEEIISCVTAMSVIGVSRNESVNALGAAAQHVAMSPQQIANLLGSTAQLHSRVVDALDYHDDAGDVLRSLCRPLFTAVGKRLDGVNAFSLARSDPMLIITLRKLCEQNADVHAAVPGLWEKIRCVPISQTQRRRCENKIDRPFAGALGNIQTIRRKKPHDSDNREKRDRFIPPQFRGWLGTKPQQRHLRVAKVASKMRFGARRIPHNYLKTTRRRHEKSNY